MKKTENQIIEFYVSPQGSDRWSGRRATPNRRRTDGPWASIGRAQRAVRQLKVKGVLPTAVRVILRGGLYPLTQPLHFAPLDSGSPPPKGNWNNILGPDRHVTYAAFPGEQPILSGGQQITGWREMMVRGRRTWIARVPEVRRQRWFFTQLWVNGRRASRTRLPKPGIFRVEKLLGTVVWKGDVHKTLFTGQDAFEFKAGDLEAWRNVRDIEFVALHFWIESRINFKSIDPRRRIAKLQWKSRMRLTDDHTDKGAQYYVENVFESLANPGQWYLDRPTGLLYYLPRADEKLESAEIIAPRLAQIALIQGDEKTGGCVEHLRFEGLTFSHSEWVPADKNERATPQAACHVPGAVRLRDTRFCRFEDCAITHVGTYGIEIGGTSSDVDIVGCDISDLGGGGVKIWHDPAKRKRDFAHGGKDMSHSQSPRRITVSDCEISDGGHRHHQAVGVLIGRSSGNKILHNHIHNFDYTGISVGWTWGYAEGSAYGNIIEYNHVHHIGRGMLSDMGGIYTLGVSPGTRIRHNIFHDVESRGYGGWGIYTDEGSTDILIENNLTYRTKSQGFHQHYGRDNIVRNNIFALGREGGLARSRLESHTSFVFTQNIIYLDNDGKILSGNWSAPGVVLDRNLYFQRSGKPLDFAGMNFKKWRKRGVDQNSLIADPKFRNPDRGDFRLKPDSPAARIGFQPFDLSTVGPRRRMKRISTPA